MSHPLAYDVDERISSIKNSLKQITSSFNNSDHIENSKPTKKKRPPRPIKSPRSTKKAKPHAYVSDYIAFGSENESESSIDEFLSSKKVTFNSPSSIISEKNLNLQEEYKETQEKTAEIIELEILLNYEKKKAVSLEKLVEEKDIEIDEIKRENIKLLEIMDKKDIEINENHKFIEKVKVENKSLVKHVERYQKMIKDFETMHQDLKRGYETGRNALELEAKVIEDQENIKKLLEKVNKKDLEIQNLIMESRELTKNNGALELVVKEFKEIVESPCEVKKLKEKVKELKLINSTLEEKLSSNPKSLQGTQKKLQDLEKVVHDLLNKKPSKKISDLPKKLSHPPSKVLNSLQSLLKTKSYSQIPGKVTSLLHNQDSKNLDLTKKLRNLVLKYSPPGSIKKLPNDHKIYTWIKRLVKEYLKKSKDSETTNKNLEVLKNTMKMLNITFPEDLLNKVEELINNSKL